jgi:hypothetical protein
MEEVRRPWRVGRVGEWIIKLYGLSSSYGFWLPAIGYGG